jgi:hypothetical protein
MNRRGISRRLQTLRGWSHECIKEVFPRDIAPTLLGLTNASPEKKAAIAKGLPGKDLAPLLSAPEKATQPSTARSSRR